MAGAAPQGYGNDRRSVVEAEGRVREVHRRTREEGTMPEAEGNRRASMRGRILFGIAGAIILMGSLLVRPAQAQLLDVPKT